MANRKSGRQGSGIIALIAVVAAVAAGPSAALAKSGESKAPPEASVSVSLPAFDYSFSFEASWAE
jgi:hypothetical protein